MPRRPRHKRNERVQGERASPEEDQAQQFLVEAPAKDDGIGTPDPNSKHLVNWCV